MSYYNNDEQIRAIKDLRSYMEIKYGRAYMSAIAKLYVLNQKDDKMFLKPELVLTSEEKNALLFYVPETSKFLSKIDTIVEDKVEQPQQQTFDDRYQVFLNDVRKYADKIVNDSLAGPMSKDVQYDLIGPEFRKKEIIEKYGEDIYNKACSEIPEDKERKRHGRHSTKDFAKANIKLGVMFNEGVRASYLLDLDYLIASLEKEGIPCYIDFETNIFHFNAIPTKSKTR